MKLSALLNDKWVKYPMPVLSPGRCGEWDDQMTDCPSVFSDAQGRYRLYYTGHSTKTHKWCIGFAESVDLFNWTKHEKNPVLKSGEGQSWDKRIDGANVFKHKDKYYLFYEATSSFSLAQSRAAYLIPYPLRKMLGAARRWIRSFGKIPVSQAAEHAKGRCIGFAVSEDGVNWVKYHGNPVLKPSGGDRWDSKGVFSPYVQFIDGLFYMFYGGSGKNKICSGIAASKDMITWERRDEPILTAGQGGAWDDSSVLIVSVIRLEDAWCAFYEGQDVNNNYGIGIAFSYDLKHWTKHEKNPIITKGEKGSFGERMVNSPHVFIEEDRVFLFYGAQNFNMQGYSMAAYLDSGK